MGTKVTKEELDIAAAVAVLGVLLLPPEARAELEGFQAQIREMEKSTWGKAALELWLVNRACELAKRRSGGPS